ncbi:MAG: hypothetical protein JWM28_1418 [Chitinophagaceae bacterium]|nr:hypothetical protein [Chitinophagaceae bacterium]
MRLSDEVNKLNNPVHLKDIFIKKNILSGYCHTLNH